MAVVYQRNVSTSCLPPLKDFEMNFVPNVYAVNPVVCALSLLKLFNFLNGGEDILVLHLRILKLNLCFVCALGGNN